MIQGALPEQATGGCGTESGKEAEDATWSALESGCGNTHVPGSTPYRRIPTAPTPPGRRSRSPRGPASPSLLGTYRTGCQTGRIRCVQMPTQLHAACCQGLKFADSASCQGLKFADSASCQGLKFADSASCQGLKFADSASCRLLPRFEIC